MIWPDLCFVTGVVLSFVDDPFPVMQEKCHLCCMFAPFWRLSRWVAQPNDYCVFSEDHNLERARNFPFCDI